METDENTKQRIRYALDILRNSGEVLELRALTGSKGVTGGYFDDADTIADAAAELNGTANVVVTLNPVNPALLARISNRTMPRFSHKLRDADILKRNWLLVKVEPVRPEGISATDEEHQAAVAAASKIRGDLADAGWPLPALASDGNGADLLYYIDLPNDEESTRTIQDVLTALDATYSTDTVTVDTSTYQATQRVRLYGTVAMIGDSTGNRPHRASQIMDCPDELDGVTLEQMAEIAAQVQQTRTGDQGQEAAEETQTEALIRLGSEARFFKDEIDEAYAAVDVDGHTELWKLKSKSFGLWLTKKYFEETGKAPGTDAMRQARSVMEMKAMFAGDQRQLHLRVARLDGAIYYDLADRDWRVVKVTLKGCRVPERPPILFVRNKNSQAQAEPDFDGNVRQLLDHVRVKDEHEQLLYLVYVVSCMVPDIPHPVLVLCGEKGAAKTTAARMTRAIVDPAMRDLLIMPNATADLALTIANNYMPAFDNLDSLSSEKSDLLCTAATGGSFSKRALFTDDDEVLLSFKRCVVLNGINLVVTKPDLLDRSIILELERIAEEERKEERAIWESFEADRPHIIGGVLAALSKAMKTRCCESGDGSLTHLSFYSTIFTKSGIRVIVMPRRGRKLSVSQTYHIMIRGNERRNIFLDDEDRARFIDTLHAKSQPNKFTLYAYCLMDNHAHLLIGERTDEISKIMKSINVSYAYYFNRKYRRIGHLFQDRFKSEGIEDDTYLLSVTRYIHNNPVRANIVKYAGEYKWSSYGIYANIQRDIRGLVDKEEILELFSPSQTRAVELFIEYSKMESTDTFIDLKKADDERKPIRNELDAEEFIGRYLNEQGIGLEDIKMKKNKVYRDSLIVKLKDKLNLSVREIANLLGLGRNIVQRIK